MKRLFILARSVAVLLIIVCTFSVAGDCQATGANVRGQAQKATEPATVSDDFVIGPDDQLQISVWREPDLSGSVPVRPDGKISLALLNDVQAAGLTPMQLANSLTEKLKHYINNPQVSVVVRQINSRKYYITGEVRHGGAFPLASDMTVLQALTAAGGFNDFANLSKIYILRQENGKGVKYAFNYKEVIRGENVEQNRVLKPGDTIVVP